MISIDRNRIEAQRVLIKLDDTPESILANYPLNIQMDKPHDLRYQTVKRLPAAFHLLGAVKSCEELTESIFRAMVDKRTDTIYRDTLIQTLPGLIKVL